MKRSKLIIFMASVALFAIIYLLANRFGYVTENGTFETVRTLPVFYLGRDFNLYQFTAPWYRAAIYAYWYTVSLILAFAVFILSKRLSKVSFRKERGRP